MNIEISSRRFSGKHHTGWFKFYRFDSGAVEIWFGQRFIDISWEKQ